MKNIKFRESSIIFEISSTLILNFVLSLGKKPGRLVVTIIKKAKIDKKTTKLEKERCSFSVYFLTILVPDKKSSNVLSLKT